MSMENINRYPYRAIEDTGMSKIRWLYGDLILKWNNRREEYDRQIAKGSHCDIIHEHTICMGTGKRDINNTGIYERDILKTPQGELFVVIWAESFAGFVGITPEKYRGEKFWNPKRSDKLLFPEIWYRSFIAGNLYETPDIV